MRKLLLILVCLAMPYFIMAQEIVKQKEIGLVFSNLDNFGLTFKTGNDKALWRFTTLFISGNNMENTSDSLVDKQNSMGFGVKIGKEYRKILVNNLEFRIGADLSFSYNQSTYDYNDKTINNFDRKIDRTTFQYGVNLVLGLNYKFNDSFIFGAELLPNFSYMTGSATEKYYYTNYGKEIKSTISGFNYGLTNTSVLLSLAYKF